MNPEKMQDVAGHHGYQVALFDILGFESRLQAWGLEEMRRRYEALIWRIAQIQIQMTRVFEDMKFREAPYWTKEGVSIVNRIHGAYASDSLLLWANRTWPEARGASPQELQEISKSKTAGWRSSPIPCDNFMDACNEILCHGLEVGLPLRGALSMGDAVFDERKRLYLGYTMVEAARLEKAQRFIGGGLCKSFRNQIIPRRYYLEFDRHLKHDGCAQWGGAVLDWPRHWRNTRGSDPTALVAEMNTSSAHKDYYQHTLRSIEASQALAGNYENESDIEIRNQYPEFSWGNVCLELPARAVRRVPA